MMTTDWIIDISLILIVLRQIKEHRLDWKFVLIPLVLTGFTAATYLHTVPTAGNDLPLILTLGAAGAVLGLLSAFATHVRTGPDAGSATGTAAFVRAGFWAAALWIVGVGTRLAFQLYATHGGASAIARFSAHHDITTGNAWTAALVIMALAEVVTRVGVILIRAHHAVSTAATARVPATV